MQNKFWPKFIPMFGMIFLSISVIALLVLNLDVMANGFWLSQIDISQYSWYNYMLNQHGATLLFIHGEYLFVFLPPLIISSVFALVFTLQD